MYLQNRRLILNKNFINSYAYILTGSHDGTHYSSCSIDSRLRPLNSTDLADFHHSLPFNKIPGPSRLPYLGNLHNYISGSLNKFKYHQVLKQYFEKYGPIFQETLAGKTTVHVFQPEMLKVIYQDEGKYPDIEPLLETSQKFRSEEAMSLGLGNSNGELWYKLRSAVQKHMMKPVEVSAYLPQVNEVANEFVDKLLQNRQCDDFLMECSKWSLESSGYISFGRRLGYLNRNSEKEREAAKMVMMNNQMFTLSTSLKFSVPFYKYFQTPAYKLLHEAETYFARISDSYLSETLQQIQSQIKDSRNVEDIEKRYKFVFSLFSQRNFERKDIGIITLSMFGDGLRTTIPALVSTMYCLSTSKNKQNKLFDEVNRVLEDRTEITVNDIANMPYLKACVKEALRLYPIGLEVSRINKANLVLGGFQIPSGTVLNMNNFIMFRNENHFSDPDTFIPERWLRSSNASIVDPFVLMPFGRGPRMCAGRRFAEQDMYVMVCKLVQKCKLQWMGGIYDHQFKILMYPDCETSISFEPR